MEKILRETCFIEKPNYFEIICPICATKNLDWSEFEHHIWCNECELDICGYDSPMSGPFPVNTTRLLGINIDMYNIKTGKRIEL